MLFTWVLPSQGGTGSYQTWRVSINPKWKILVRRYRHDCTYDYRRTLTRGDIWTGSWPKVEFACSRKMREEHFQQRPKEVHASESTSEAGIFSFRKINMSDLRLFCPAMFLCFSVCALPRYIHNNFMQVRKLFAERVNLHRRPRGTAVCKSP